MIYKKILEYKETLCAVGNCKQLDFRVAFNVTTKIKSA